MTVVDFDVLDVDDLRFCLITETNAALGLADEMALAIETGRWDDARDLATQLRESRGRMRRLRLLIRVEEGQR